MLLNILIAILLAAVTYMLAGWFGLPYPVPAVLALVVGLISLLRDRVNI